MGKTSAEVKNRYNSKNRIVFCINDNILEIAECGSHYKEH